MKCNPSAAVKSSLKRTRPAATAISLHAAAQSKGVQLRTLTKQSTAVFARSSIVKAFPSAWALPAMAGPVSITTTKCMATLLSLSARASACSNGMFNYLNISVCNCFILAATL
jgi:hypothetical protein